MISIRLKEAVKTGLAMSLACGIALGLGWDKPYWACIAVAVVSLPTVGESFNKSITRIIGTPFGALVSLLCISLFVQDRWLFFAFLSVFVGLCAYRITVARNVYFWFISGYVCMLVASYVQLRPDQIFTTAVIRFQETCLGILVYGLVSVFVWPQHCADYLRQTVQSILNIQAKTATYYFTLLTGRAKEADAKDWYGLQTQFIGQLKRRLDAAETEQFEIYEARAWWRHLTAQCQALMESMESWRECFHDLKTIDIPQLLPNISAVQNSIGNKFKKLVNNVALHTCSGMPADTPFQMDHAYLETLSHVKRAAALNMASMLQQIESITTAIDQCLQEIRMPRGQRGAPPHHGAAVLHQPDADSYVAAFRAFLGIWLAALAWIAFDVPGHISFITFVSIHILIGTTAPQIKWGQFLLANSLGVLIAALLYVFVMPHLPSYTGLSIMLFLLTTAVYYIFGIPRLGPFKLAAIVPFIMLTNLQSSQTYDFASFANNGSTMLLTICFATAVFNFPIPSRPEKMLLRLTGRYFRQARACLSLLDTAAKENTPRTAATLAAMQASVTKLGGWAASINYRALPVNAPEKTFGMVGHLSAILFRFKMLLDARVQASAAVSHCSGQFGEWQTAIDTLLHQWEYDRFQPSIWSSRIEEHQKRRLYLEEQFETTFRTLPTDMDPTATAGLYQFLGCYRGLYKALLSATIAARDIDWEYWREYRF